MSGNTYMLEISDKEDRSVALISFDSETPFGAIQVGDLMNPGGWDLPNAGQGSQFKVVEIEHILWQRKDGIAHKIVVIVEDIGEWYPPQS